MAPRRRKKENEGLSKRWTFAHNAYYYQVPPGLEPQWDGYRFFPLGRTLPDAYRTWAERVQQPGALRIVNDLFDRYALEVLPAKAAKTQREQTRSLMRLRAVFGSMPLATSGRQSVIEPHHAYSYFDRRSAKTAAKREIELLSHTLTKAVEWGCIKANPLGHFTLKGRMPKSGSVRYVEDWEIIEVLKVEPRRKLGSILMVKAYIKLKLLTGLRMTDTLLLRGSHLKDDGIHIMPHKTQNSSGAARIIEWDDGLQAAVQEALGVRPVDISPYGFCNARNEPYFNEVRGTANGFGSIRQRFMVRALTETALVERFPERSLRRKAGTDTESLEHAESPARPLRWAHDAPLVSAKTRDGEARKWLLNSIDRRL